MKTVACVRETDDVSGISYIQKGVKLKILGRTIRREGGVVDRRSNVGVSGVSYDV